MKTTTRKSENLSCSLLTQTWMIDPDPVAPDPWMSPCPGCAGADGATPSDLVRGHCQKQSGDITVCHCVTNTGETQHKLAHVTITGMMTDNGACRQSRGDIRTLHLL